MNYPKLVKPWVQKTPIRIEVDDGTLNMYGEPADPHVYEGTCNYQDRATTVLTSEKKLIDITGTALFDGDILPDLPVISGGEAYIFGVTRRIASGQKHRNPDGTENYTEVNLV